MDAKTDELFGGLAHDLRGPLSAIMGYLDLAMRLTEKSPEGEKIKKYLQAARDGSIRLNRMVSDLSDVTRLQDGQMPIALESVTATEFLEEVRKPFMGMIEMKRLTLTVQAEAQEPLRIHRDLMVRSLENLLHHAIKITPSEGTIEMAVRSKEKGLVCEILSSGRTLPQEELDNLFNRFEQMTPQSHSSSSGLGLAIARYVAIAHGGLIEAGSNAGKGNRFAIWIPNRKVDAKAA